MPRTTHIAACFLVACCGAAPALPAQSDDVAAVRRVIESAYVRGIHIERDSAAVRRGFHPRFVMSTLRGDSLAQVTLDQWLSRMDHGRRNSVRVEHAFDRVEVVGNTATARLRLSYDGRQRFTDFLSLYRFPEGWRIVNKAFQAHE
jgi:hypothetical protein